MYCGYSLEAPRRGASNEHPHVCFYGKLSSDTPPEQHLQFQLYKTVHVTSLLTECIHVYYLCSW